MEQEAEMTDGSYEDIKPMFEGSPSNEVIVMTRDKLGEIVQAATTGRYYIETFNGATPNKMHKLF